MRLQIPLILLAIGLFPTRAVCQTEAPPPRGPVAKTWDEAYQRLGPIPGRGAGLLPPHELKGKIIAGYQGWFSAEGDGSGIGWRHYGGKNLGPGNCSFDLWPDMSELTAGEKFPTAFKNADGSAATLFSSYHPQTVDRHFQWMQDYDLDGVMLQRFGVSLKSPQSYDFNTAVMRNVRLAAAKHDRDWAVMYDLSGMKAGELFPIITKDWKRLVGDAKILTDRGYFHLNRKPLVSLWGIGFSDGRAYGLKECEQLVDFFHEQGAAVMLGIPYYWRDGNRDAIADPDLKALLKKADLLSPWAVGRYQGSESVAKNLPARLGDDLAWCQENGPSYLPVIFPGFSWQNLQKGHGKQVPLNAIPREGGKFLWQQALEAKRAGAGMIYLAMFDEVDEGTAILKASNTPPSGESNFITYENLPADHYLWLSGEIGKMLRGGLPKDNALPKR